MVALGAGDDVNASLDLQGSVAVSDHFGLMSNFYTAWGNEPGYGSGRGSMFEIGGGYFSKVAPKFVFSFFGGVGAGAVTNYYDDARALSSRLNFRRMFLQPAFGFRSRYFDGALSLRAANLYYS